MDTRERLEQSFRACERLTALPEFVAASVVMMYAATRHELECRFAMEHAMDDGKTVLLPGIDWEAKFLIPRRLPDVRAGLATFRHGILEPPKQWPEAGVETIDMVVVPGIAFDEAGRRLGRGGGFYDRFLSRIPARTRRIGLALEVQGLREVPAGEQDARVDAVVLPSRVWRCPPRDGSGLAR
jgi:5-formyltetrahydrofolate cyclo-ligase